jgi:hypothetical protein
MAQYNNPDGIGADLDGESELESGEYNRSRRRVE